MNVVEPIADAVTGSLAARAVEPGNGIDRSGHTTERACLNCGTPLAGDYCHACGQKGHVHRSLGAFGHDLLHGVFHFEGKIWRTLPMLAWCPGALTRRYIDGERARFIGPLPLFLFTIFLVFAVAGVTASSLMPVNVQVREGFDQEVRDTEASLAAARTRLGQAAPGSAEAERLRKEVADLDEDLGMMRSIKENGFVRGAAIRASDDVPGPIGAALRQATGNPDLFLFKVKTTAYKYSWALIPLSVPFVWLLFPFSRRFGAYDHLVFVTYSLCFMSLLACVAMAWRMAALPAPALLALIPPVHIYRHVRGTYGLSRGGALWRSMLLTCFAVSILVSFAIGLLALGLFD